MAALFTHVLFIDLVTDTVIESRLMPINRLDTASKAHARHLATINHHPVLAYDEEGMSWVMPPKGQSVNTYARPRCNISQYTAQAAA